MKTYSELSAQHEASFPGKKIGIDEILNKSIIVNDFKVKDSKFTDGSGICLTLAIVFETEERVVFSGSKVLLDFLKKLSKQDFPFTAAIKKEYRAYKFS